MKHGFVTLLILSSLLVLGIFLAGCTSTPNTPGTHSLSMDQPPPATPFPSSNGSAATVSETGMVTANNQFARDLYLQLARDPQYARSNIFFSPFSLSSALAITYEGARGTTADEIRSVFHFPSDNTLLREGFSNVNAGINNGDTNYTLNTANALWAEKTFPFMPDYISTAGCWYSANVTNLDFISKPEASRQTINTWVANRTHDKIQNLLPAGSIDPLTRLVITNAVYFKGIWEKQFDANDTQDADFHISPQNTVIVKMMQRTDEDAVYPYAETANLQVLSIPYAHGTGSGLSMIVLLPKNDSLAAAETALDPRNLSALEQSISSQRVMIYFPKFKLETQYGLPGTLAAMGMPTAFTGTADFTGMDGKRDLYISDVVHKAFVNVDEDGTEAAAATGVVMRWNAVVHETPVPVFRADHPFLFLIQDNDTGAILFAGRVVNPNGT
jgi:serpin B